MTCKTCRFNQPIPGGELGLCRVHAPRLQGIYGIWPTTRLDRDWCGEYEADPIGREERESQP